MAASPHHLATGWLSAFATALRASDAAAASQLFLPDGWLRDLLVFTWDLRSLRGREKIASYLSRFAPSVHITDVALDEDTHLAPRHLVVPQLKASGVELAFIFECTHGHGRAYARLLPDVDGVYRVFSLMMELRDLHGYEETPTLRLKDANNGIPSRDMGAEFTEWVRQVETAPYAVIVGAGQTGLQVAARFKQMNIPALLIERHPREHHTLLYQPYPSDWPEFTPRDKLADWLEQYARTQDLVVWTKSTLLPGAAYGREKQEWDITVLREGRQVKLHPAHLVFAIGTLGEPHIPTIPGANSFQGETLHSSEYRGGRPYAGRHVVVVGAGSSSIDICQDLVGHGAQTVTMVQRSPTCIVSRDFVSRLLHGAFPYDVPLPVSDFKWASMPVGLIKDLMVADQQTTLDANKELHDKLRAGGVLITMGDEGQGIYLLGQERFGGYWLDKGGAGLIAEGTIAVKSGVFPQQFTERGLILNDDLELVADAVVFATGYGTVRDVSLKILGERIIGQVDRVYGLDDEFETNGSYRPCGHPGLWFATGDFFMSRFMSKPLALQIKAMQAGLLKHDGTRERVRQVARL